MPNPVIRSLCLGDRVAIDDPAATHAVKRPLRMFSSSVSMLISASNVICLRSAAHAEPAGFISPEYEGLGSRELSPNELRVHCGRPAMSNSELCVLT